jgi:UDP-N-acetylmuramoyl-L-alanyl-D-glutamate--2,6-diaminopimelate ligase
LKRLSEILAGLANVSISGNESVVIKNLQIDSRKVYDSNLFFAISGTQTDGHQFIGKAIENGAKAIVCEELPEILDKNVSYILTDNARIAMSKITSNFYDEPDKKVKLIGVTGTNGKTTVATLLYRLALDLGFKAGLISTIEYRINEEVFPSTHTTPDIISLMQLFDQMVNSGCDYVFMEVSSHAIHQGRVEGLDFDGAIFTNITRDHLDYHKTFKNYIYSKKKFFDDLKPEAFALTNIDDPNGLVMVQNTKATIKTYSLNSLADFKAKILNISLLGLECKINQHNAFFKLTGKFNAYNLLAVFGASVLTGWNENEVIVAMSNLDPINGRFDILYDQKSGIHAVIDYAHTPDALENLLTSILKIRNSNQKIITVFGAGGNRDKGKRPLMGKIAGVYSDKIIVTSDNPRNEDPNEIILDITEGIEEKDKKKVLQISNRKEAIKTAIMMANKNDVIVIAGKGHENYQIIGDNVLHFSDKETVIEIWKN